MRIAILSRNQILYSTRRLVRTARERGHLVQVIDTMSIVMTMGTAVADNNLKIVTQSAMGIPRSIPIRRPEAIIPRIGSSITEFGVAVVRYFEAQGIYAMPSADGIARSRDKLFSYQLMSRNNLPIPQTTVLAKEHGLLSAVQAVGGFPLIVKPVRSTQGKGVVLVQNLVGARRVANEIRHNNQQVLFQEFVAEAKGKDVRVIVIGNQCVAAMKRSAAEGDFRSNLHMGGTAVAVKLNQTERNLAIAAAKAHGLAIAGVDLIQAKRGTLVLEVNSSPGLEGIEQATGVDVAAAIVAQLERNGR